MQHTPRLRGVLTLLALLALAGVSGTASAAPPRGGHSHGPGHPPDGGPAMLERLFDELDLSAGQREQAEAVLADHREAARGVLDRLGEAHAEMRDQIHADTLDEQAIREIASRMADAEAEMALARARTWQQIRGILTPEQRTEAQALFEKRRARMQERHERFRMGPPGGPFHGEGPGDGPEGPEF